MANPLLIAVDNLRRYFSVGKQPVRALDDLSLRVERGAFLGITGPSGSGKSTLLYILGGLDRPTAGRIEVDGQDISALDEDGLSEFRQQKIGFIFQMFNLIPTMTALENVEFPMLFTRSNANNRRQRAQQLLELVGLHDRMSHRPTELSGGQQQRVAVARALANDPTIILADEPTGNLDSRSGSEVMELLSQLNQQGRTVIMVSHDLNVITRTRRQIRLHDGRLVEDSPVEAIGPAAEAG